MRHTIVYLHGVGGARGRDIWFGPLNSALQTAGVSPIDSEYDVVVEPEYRESLWSEEPFRRLSRDVAPAAEDEVQRYVLSQERAHRVAKVHQQGAQMDPALVPDWVAKPVTALGAARMVDAQRYRKSEAARNRVLQHVLDELPAEGELVVLAHSLGSVVAVDLLSHLPESLFVSRLVTLGSPLALPGLWPGTKALQDRFPYQRIGSWVNVLDGRDPVTGGRHVSQVLPQALDVPVRVAGRHAVSAYSSHPVVAALVGDALYGDADGAARGGSVPSARPLARRLSEDWHPILLAYAYSNQLSRSCATEKTRWKVRFDTARRIAAERLVESASMSAPEHPEVEPLAATPTVADLTMHAADLVRDHWTDEELLPLAVALHMSAPIAPFDIEVDRRHRDLALRRVLETIRQRSSLSSDEFVETLCGALDEISREFRQGAGAWPALVGLGVAVLALTGVGLVVAAPAGLAGAAAISATLAAFGPGGMVGGMLTIVAMTGAGTAFLGVGVGVSAGNRSESLAIDSISKALVRMSRQELRAGLIGALATSVAGERLGHISSAQHLEMVLELALAEATSEHALHERICPKGASTKEWESKVELLRLGLAVLRAKMMHRDEHAFAAAVRAAPSVRRGAALEG